MPSFDQCVAHFLFKDFLSGIWFVCPALQPAVDGMAKANSFSSPAAATRLLFPLPLLLMLLRLFLLLLLLLLWSQVDLQCEGVKVGDSGTG